MLQLLASLIKRQLRDFTIGYISKNQNTAPHTVTTVTEYGDSPIIEAPRMFPLLRTLGGEPLLFPEGTHKTSAACHHLGDGPTGNRTQLFAEQLLGGGVNVHDSISGVGHKKAVSQVPNNEFPGDRSDIQQLVASEAPVKDQPHPNEADRSQIHGLCSW